MLAQQISGFAWLLFTVFLLIHVYGIVAGLLCIENSPKATVLLLPYWIIQIPVVDSAALTYRFSSGAHFNLSVSEAVRVNFDLGIGAKFMFYIGNTTPFQIGANFVAIAVVYKLAAFISDRRTAQEA